MFTSNLWAMYVWGAGTVIAVYYLYVVIKFYDSEIKSWLAGKRKSLPGEPATSRQQDEIVDLVDAAQGTLPELPQPQAPRITKFGAPVGLWKNRVLAGQTQSLSEHLIYLIREAHDKNYERQELTLLLQMTLSDYLDFNGTQFQLEINKCIENQCAKYGSLHLGEQEIAAIWSKV